MRPAADRDLESALVLPVPEAEPVVGAWRTRHDPSAGLGVPAHITVLYPFLGASALSADVIARLGRLFADTAPIQVRLDGVCGFPGVVWLSPEPAGPLASLTAMVRAVWPGCRPYRGAFTAVVPHLTVAQSQDMDLLAHAAISVAARLPVTAGLRSASLLCEGADGRWSARARFPFARR